MAGNVFNSKAALRQAVEARRRALTGEQVERWGGQVQRNLAALPLFAQARTVALYAAQSFEVPTWSLLDQLGERAVFPRVERGSRVLQFHQVATRSLLVPRGRLQLLEPPGDAPVVPLLDIDLFVVPGVAFSPDGRRLGRGGGYYDQTLALAPNALAVGVAFECCVEDDVPVDPHDRLVDALVTESRTLVLQRRR